MLKMEKHNRQIHIYYIQSCQKSEVVARYLVEIEKLYVDSTSYLHPSCHRLFLNHTRSSPQVPAQPATEANGYNNGGFESSLCFNNCDYRERNESSLLGVFGRYTPKSELSYPQEKAANPQMVCFRCQAFKLYLARCVSLVNRAHISNISI